MLNTFFQGGHKFCRGASPSLRPPGYGPGVCTSETAAYNFCNACNETLGILC